MLRYESCHYFEGSFCLLARLDAQFVVLLLQMAEECIYLLNLVILFLFRFFSSLYYYWVFHKKGVPGFTSKHTVNIILKKQNL